MDTYIIPSTDLLWREEKDFSFLNLELIFTENEEVLVFS